MLQTSGYPYLEKMIIWKWVFLIIENAKESKNSENRFQMVLAVKPNRKRLTEVMTQGGDLRDGIN